MSHQNGALAGDADKKDGKKGADPVVLAEEAVKEAAPKEAAPKEAAPKQEHRMSARRLRRQRVEPQHAGMGSKNRRP